MNRVFSRSILPRAALLGFAGAVAIAAPFLLSPYRVSELTIVVAYAIALIGLTVLVGYSGQVSLAHASFFAVGAYGSAILVTKASWPFLLSIPVAGLVALLVGLLIGFPAMRLSGLYLAVATVALAVATPPVIKRWDTLTSGAEGIVLSPVEGPSWIALAPDQYLYFVALMIFVVLALASKSLVTSHIGRSLSALRDSDTAAASFGVSGLQIKPRAFAFSAWCAGVGGAIFGAAVGFVAPESFGIVLALGFLAAVTIGGLGSVLGTLGGALFLMYVPQVAGEIDPGLTGIIYGLAMIAVVFILPGGIASLFSLQFRKKSRTTSSSNDVVKNGSE